MPVHPVDSVFIVYSTSCDDSSRHVVRAFTTREPAYNHCRRLNTPTELGEDQSVASAAEMLKCSFSVSSLPVYER